MPEYHGLRFVLAILEAFLVLQVFRTKLHTTALPKTQLLFPVPIRGTAATLLEVATLTAVTGGIYVNCAGYSST